MKKCASCTKDLPDAALHCVFCGAKQGAAPAVQPGLAKTSFGYSANDVMNQLGNQPPQQPQGGYQPPSSGLASPAAANAATIMVAPGGGPQGFNQPQGGYTPPAPAPAPSYGQPQGGYGGAPQGGGYQPPQQQPYSPPGGYGGGGMGIHSPPQPTPSPLPVAAAPPYLASNTAARAGRPIEPWKDSLKFLMLVWGAVALVTFAVPVSIDPLGFNWDMIIDGPGVMKIPFLMWAAVGLVALAVAAIPMDTLPRGIIAAVLGLAGLLVPTFAIVGMPPWQALLPLVGMLTLVPGLLVRHEYTESLVARILVTIGVVATLLPLLIPIGGQIPLVSVFKGLIEAPGEAKVGPILQIAQVVLVVTALLAWMPGPATGGAKVIAWAMILFPVLEFAIELLLGGNIGDVVSKRPGMLVQWAPQTVYMVLTGYGLATVIGKQLE